MFERLLTVVTPLFIVGTILLPVRPSVPSPSAQGQATREPLEYFREMVPVFTHDRCLNCHGAVNPSTGQDHDGGVIGAGESCSASGCHSQANNANEIAEDDWRIAPAAVSFVGKDAKALCEQMADRVATFGNQDFMDHLQSDFQIDLGFEGRSGGANDDPQGVPPPMTKTKFLVAAARWMDEGFAACDREGTITHTEEVNSDNTYNAGTIQQLRVQQTGKREVTIRFANGRYEARVQVKGSVTNTQTARQEVNGVSCTTIITSTTDYEDAEVSAPGGASTGGISGGAGVTVKLERSGEYTVTVQLGDEKHRQLDRYSVQDGCGVGLQASPPESLEQDWPGTAFVFRGKLPNPGDRTRLVGRELKRVFGRKPGPDEDPWLPDHYSVLGQDGSWHPVDVKTSWNLRYRP